jgi:XTP/dITP diphosphohydrolase
MKIVFATNNAHKLQEIREILGSDFEIVSLADIGCHADIPETGNTLEENARQKAEYIMRNYHINCFADDTGLEVEALDGAPGVHSARYAEGTDHNSEANMAKLLRELKDKTNRAARFRTVISLLTVTGEAPSNYREIQFEGEVRGHIDTEKHGTEGFGYDPIFIPEGYDKSFAELGEDVKNQISHRARAVKKLAAYLKEGSYHQ